MIQVYCPFDDNTYWLEEKSYNSYVQAAQECCPELKGKLACWVHALDESEVERLAPVFYGMQTFVPVGAYK